MVWGRALISYPSLQLPSFLPITAPSRLNGVVMTFFCVYVCVIFYERPGREKVERKGCIMEISLYITILLASIASSEAQRSAAKNDLIFFFFFLFYFM